MPIGACLKRGFLAACLVLPCLALAALKLDRTKSSVDIVFKQLNVPVAATFKKFNAHIDFDSAHPESARANIEIDISSFDLGEPEYNQEVFKKEWFYAAQFPSASFSARTIKPSAHGKFEVVGPLTIKGKTSEVRFPVNIKQEGARQIFEGQLPIKRLAFNIGEGEWKDTGIVADDVLIKFHLVTLP